MAGELSCPLPSSTGDQPATIAGPMHQELAEDRPPTRRTTPMQTKTTSGSRLKLAHMGQAPRFLICLPRPPASRTT